jgi:hypothetical protein
MKNKKLIILLIIMGITNCATFTEMGEDFEKVELSKTVKPEKIIVVRYTQKSLLNGNEVQVNPIAITKQENKFKESLKGFLYFKEVRTGLETGDIKVELQAIDNGEVNLALGFITGLSLYIIPSYAVDNYELTYIFKDKRDKVIKEYKRKITFKTWQGLIFLPIMPFKFITKEMENGFEEMNKSVIKDAEKDGIIFDKNTPNAI